MMPEVYAIYMTIRKLSFYLDDMDTTLRSDHLSWHWFLEKNILNSNLNNWGVKIEQYHIKFEYIKGI